LPSDLVNPAATNRTPSNPWITVLLAALAGGLGWGIRGQYGHETGAMMPGLLVGLVLVLRLASHLPPLAATRAVAFGTVAMGFGGSETYGQTLGLTHDAPLLGNWDALRWGFLGLAIKGGIWIGFAGLFLGMGLGGVRYRPREIVVLMSALPLLQWIGMQVLNEPFDPANRVLPRVYFSDSWFWEPEAVLKPRREYWGGLLLALVGAWLWAGWRRSDGLARRLMPWGFLGGAVGFPAGQCLQAWHAWNPEVFNQGFWLRLAPYMNWWNWMETTFGFVMAAILALGLLFHRHRIVAPASAPVAPAPWVELSLLGLHLTLLLLEEFGSIPFFNALYDPGFLLGWIPMVAVACGRFWPAWVLFPVTLVPIAGKTFQNLVLQEKALGVVPGAVLFLILPLLLAGGMTVGWIRRQSDPGATPTRLRRALLILAWLYFGLNFAFFRYPWPWTDWTPRTPNALFYLVAVLGITVGVFLGNGFYPVRKQEASNCGNR